MNVLFVNPPFKGKFSRTSRSPAVTKGGTLYYPFWLAYAAGVTEQAKHNVKLIDAPADDLSIDNILKSAKLFEPQLIVIDTSTPSIYSDVEVAATFKSEFPKSFVVLVGTHPSALPEATLKLNNLIDGVTVGEYDFIIRDLAHTLEKKGSLFNVDGLAFRIGKKININREREKIIDLDSIPFVSKVYKEHMKIQNYFFAASNYPMVMIITGRGCPFHCFFCVYPQVFHSRKYRVRSPENVVAEFEYIKKIFPFVKEVGIEDDCFTVDKDRVKKICELLIKRKVKMKWYCNVRGDLDYKLLTLMKKAGCRLVTVGFESASQEVLNNLKKGEKVERYYKFAYDAKRAGVLVHGCIMTGNPGDSKITLRKSYDFAKKINCDSMQFYPLYVYPETEAYQWAKENGYLKTEDFSQWLTKEGLHNCVLNFNELSAEEMVYWCDYYLKKYHLRFGYILMKLKQAFLNPSEGLRTFKSAKVFLSKLIKNELGKSR